MENRIKRFLALALALFMVIGMMPTNIAFATEDDTACEHRYVDGVCEVCGEAESAGNSEEPSEEPSEDTTEDPVEGQNIEDNGTEAPLTDGEAKISDTYYSTLAEAVEKAEPGVTIVLLKDVVSIPTIDKAITIKGGVEGIEVNCAIAENFPGIDGVVAFENLTFNDRISTENRSSDQSKMTLSFLDCKFVVSEDSSSPYAIQVGAHAKESYENGGSDTTGALVVKDCKFETADGFNMNNVFINVLNAKTVKITGTSFDGKGTTKGAVSIQDYSEDSDAAIDATIENSTIVNVARGIQVGSRVNGSETKVNGNTFEGISVNAVEGAKSGAVYIHSSSNPDADVIVKVTENAVTGNFLYNDNLGSDVVKIVDRELFTGNTQNGMPIIMDEEGNIIEVSPEPEAPALPTATVTEIKNDDLTFAMNFKADEVTEEQLAYYGNWYADFVLTVNKDVTLDANGGADGYLSGQYDEWSENWVNVPFEETILQANESLKIMEYAAEQLNKPDLKITYNDIVTAVKDFDCGVFFTEEFLAANPDLEVTLELRMYNPTDESESYTVGETYVFTAPEKAPDLPTATVTEIKNDDLTFAMNFLADEVTEEQLAYYGDWYADFELTINKGVTFDANGGSDGYLSGQYDEFGEDWYNVPPSPVTLEANKPLKIMEYAAELLGEKGLKYTYKEVYGEVRDFDCGVFFEPDFLAANPDLEVTLELRMYDPEDETESYTIGKTYTFENTFIACNTATETLYTDVGDAMLDAAAEETVILLKDAKDTIVYVLEGTTLDLNGKTLEADYVTCFGDLIDDSEENTGVLKVYDKRFMIREDNKQLPIKNGEGYQFIEVIGFNTRLLEDGRYVFQPLFEAAAHELLLKGAEVSGVTINARVSWKQNDGVRHQDFVYDDAKVSQVVSSYNADTGKYGKMFTLSLVGTEAFKDLTYTVVVVSDTGVESAAANSESDSGSDTEKEPGNVTTDDNNQVAEEVVIENDQASAVVSEGTQLEQGATNLTLTISEVSQSESNITLGEGETAKSVDVHIDGISEDNQVPAIITLPAFADTGLNEGNIALYHVENGETNAMSRVSTLAEVEAHNEFYYDPATGDVTMALATFSEVAVVSDTTKAWEGSADHSWYDASKDELTIANADQLWSFSQIVGGMAKDAEGNAIAQDSFANKTVKLLSDINLGDAEASNDPNLIFYPIGYYNSEGTYEKTGNAISSGFKTFEGTFDGNGHIISNFYQNTWEMKGDNEYYAASEQYYRDGMGLFGKVYGGTVKNLTVANFSSDGEYTTTGVIAAYADCGATFENIAIFNCNPRVYNIGNGGIVGCVGWYADKAGTTTFKNITVDNSNKISALWGSYDVACGGIVGQYYPTSGQNSAIKNAIHFDNCHVSAVMDVYNDVCANYQYYAYRYTGMMIGSVRENEEKDGHVYPKMDGITASNCTVNFGDWNDYYYCELVANTTASYTHDHQMSRLEQVKAVNGTTITYLNGTTGTVPSSGRYDYVVVNGEHATENATCYHFVDGEVWNHEDAGYEDSIDEDGDGDVDLKEDKQHIYLEFDQLFTGYGWGVTSKGVKDFAGITTMGINYGEQEESVEKFEGKVTELSNNTEYKISDIFNFVDNGVELVPDALTVAVTNLDENNPVSAEFKRGDTNWENGTIRFTGTGKVRITIQDYYFCTPTTIDVTIKEPVAVEKFASKIDREYDFLYRVGNLDTFPVGVLFEALEDAVIDTPNVAVTVTSETEGITGTYTANTTDWTKGTLKIEGAGLVTISITDNDACEPTSVTVEVVAAKNAYTGTVPDATGTNVVLLENVSDNGFTVSGKHFYGNGFTVTCAGNGAYGNVEKNSKSLFVGYVTVEKAGTLDNVKIICNTFPESYMFTSELQAVNGTYPYSRPAVTISENSTISGCYVYGARVNILVRGGNVTIKDTITDSGALANIHIISESSYTVTLDDVTTIQSLKTADFDSNNNVLGFAVAVGTTDCTSNPTIKLTGDLKQYNWVTQNDADNVTGTYSKGIISGALAKTEYQHTINGEIAVNLGIAYVMKDFDINIVDERINKTDIPYELNEVTMKILGNNLTGKVYSIVYSETAASRNDAETDNVVGGMESTNSAYIPQFSILSDLGGQEVESYDGCEEYCYKDNGTVKVMFAAGGTKELDLASMVSITKYTNQKLDATIAVKDESGEAVTVRDGKIILEAAGEYTITYSVVDKIVYDQNGNIKSDIQGNALVEDNGDGTVTCSWTVPLSVTLKDTSIPNAYFEFDSSKQVIYADPTNWLNNGDYKQNMPFLAGLKIYDYVGQTPYLRFDGDNDFAKIAKATINNVNTTAEAKGYHIITVELTDGGKLVIDLDVRATSGSSTHTGSIKVSNNVLYVVNGGTTSAKGQLWNVYDYEFTGNNGVVINSGAITFGTNGKDAETNTAPSTNFNTKINYTVTYDANEGNCGQTTGYATSASAAVTLPTPTRSGYLFTGWYTAASGGTRVGGAGESYTPSANITLYAQWGKPSTVTYNANGGSCDKESEKYTGTALTLPTPTRDGYWFTGWYDAAEGGNKIGDAGASYQATGDITLYAQWSEVYTVTYNANGGSVNPASAKYEGTALTLPMPTREGYAFDGWSDGTDTYAAGESFTPTENVTLTARWKDPVTVTYDATTNGGNCSTTSQTFTGAALTMPAPDERIGYTFNGWYTAVSGGKKIGDAGASYTPTANITLYAQWTHDEYTITISKQSNATVTVDKATAYYNDTISVEVSFSQNNSKSLTVKDESGNTVLSKSAAGRYTFTMPASSVTIEASSSGGCVTPDTLVTLADGTQKRIDSVSADELLLVWDFYKGEYATVPASILVNHGMGTYTVASMHFSDGTTVKTIGGHGFYHEASNKFIILDENNAADYIGESFLKQDGEGFASVTLVDVTIEEMEEESWGILTAVHYNCFLEGMLTMTDAEVPGTPSYLMPFEISEGMKYDEAKMQADIETYGLYTYEDFEDLCTYEQYVGFGFDIFKVSVGKGYITWEGIEYMLSLYG